MAPYGWIIPIHSDYSHVTDLYDLDLFGEFDYYVSHGLRPATPFDTLALAFGEIAEYMIEEYCCPVCGYYTGNTDDPYCGDGVCVSEVI
jgi:hypothetical protein